MHRPLATLMLVDVKAAVAAFAAGVELVMAVAARPVPSSTAKTETTDARRRHRDGGLLVLFMVLASSPRRCRINRVPDRRHRVGATKLFLLQYLELLRRY
jgi:hypothetical protein